MKSLLIVQNLRYDYPKDKYPGTKAFLQERMKLLQNDMEVRKAWIDFRSNIPFQYAYLQNKYLKTAGNRFSYYHLFAERALELLRDNGSLGLVLPSGFQIDHSSKSLRRMFFAYAGIDTLLDFENRQQIWPSIHHAFRFTLLTTQKQGKNRKFSAAFGMYNMKALRHYPVNAEIISLDVDFIERHFPDQLLILPFKSEQEISIFEKIIINASKDQNESTTWNLDTAFDLRYTFDKALLYSKKQQSDDLPIFEGRTLQQYSFDQTQIRYWVSEPSVRQKFLGDVEDTKQELAYQRYRLAVRAVSSTISARTVVCTILPRKKICMDSVLLVDQATENIETLLYYSAVLNSFPYDWFIRANMNHTRVSIDNAAIPVMLTAAPAFQPIVRRAAQLICTTPEFDDLAAKVGLNSHANGVTDPAQRAQLRAELDGLIAHVYGLTEEEFSHILSTFPLVEAEVKEAALNEYRKLAPNPELLSLIASGESATVEFKLAACRNPHTGRNDNNMRNNIVEAVAAFMNSSGGTLLIGIADDGTITGVDVEYATANASKANWDGYELFLADLLNKSLSVTAAFQYFTITRHTLDSHDIAQVQVKPTPEPAYVNSKLYVRAGAQSKELQGPDLVEYVNGRWG